MVARGALTNPATVLPYYMLGHAMAWWVQEWHAGCMLGHVCVYTLAWWGYGMLWLGLYELLLWYNNDWYIFYLTFHAKHHGEEF